MKKPKNCQVKIQNLIKNNNLEIEVPKIIQFQNYLYRYREKLIGKGYNQYIQNVTGTECNTFCTFCSTFGTECITFCT